MGINIGMDKGMDSDQTGINRGVIQVTRHSLKLNAACRNDNDRISVIVVMKRQGSSIGTPRRWRPPPAGHRRHRRCPCRRPPPPGDQLCLELQSWAT